MPVRVAPEPAPGAVRGVAEPAAEAVLVVQIFAPEAARVALEPAQEAVRGVVEAYVTDVGAEQGFTILKSQRIFNTLELDGYDRAVDTEAKILEEIASKLGNTPNATGTIQLLTENPPCTSCQSVFQQFRQRYPNIQLKVLDGLYKVTNW